MKRYLLFIYECYYPYGGFSDFINDFDSKELALEYAKENLHLHTKKDEAYVQIVDLNRRKIVLDRKIQISEKAQIEKEKKYTQLLINRVLKA